MSGHFPFQGIVPTQGWNLHLLHNPVDEGTTRRGTDPLMHLTEKNEGSTHSSTNGLQIDGETVETVSDFIFLGSKITADGDCIHEIKRRLLLGRKVMTNLDSILKSKDSSGHRTGKGQFSFQSQRKAMPKNAQTTTQLHSAHTLVK